MAGFNIRDFTAHIHSNGVLKNNKFLVRIPYPAGFDGKTDLINTSRYLELWCEATSIPGVAMNTAETRRYGYGPVQKFAVAPSFNGNSMTFIGDAKGAVLQYFHNWIKLTNNFYAADGMNTGSRAEVSASGTGFNIVGNKPYELSYKNDYITDITIMVFSDANSGNPINIVLREAFPVAIGDIPLNWNDTNDYMKIPVQFEFTDWYSVKSGDVNEITVTTLS